MADYIDATLIDLEEALRRVRNKKQVYLMMLELFLESEEVKLLDECLENDDLENAEQYSHGIKGMVANLSMPALYRTSEQLNDELKGGVKNADTVDAYHEALEKTIAMAKAVAEQLKLRE